jgi:hypothetical protein
MPDASETRGVTPRIHYAKQASILAEANQWRVQNARSAAARPSS